MATKDLLNLIKARRSVRIFTGKKVPKKYLEEMIEAAIWAPSGCNNQELKFLILDKPKDITEIGQFKTFFQGVGAYILIFCDMSLPASQRMYIKNRQERHLPYMDTGLAMANIALTAKSLGFDTCVFNLTERHFKKPRPAGIFQKIIRHLRLKLNWRVTTMENNFEYILRHQLKVPEHLKILGGVAVGFAKFYPDVKKIFHGSRPLMRRPIQYYLIKH